MDKGYEDELYFKSGFQQKLSNLKHKKIPLTFFISLASIYIAMVITFTFVYSSYKQTHPYTAQEISEMTSVVYVLPYLDTDSGVSYYVEVDTTDDSQQTQDIIIEETTQTTTTLTDEETTAQIQETQATTTAQTETTTATTTTSVASTTTTSSSSLSTSLSSNALVYVTANGTKFHYSTCSYLSDSKLEMTYAQVLNLGYSPCSRCFPNG